MKSENLFVAVAIISMTVGFLLIFSDNILFVLRNVSEYSISILGLFPLLFGIAFIALKYLQSSKENLLETKESLKYSSDELEKYSLIIRNLENDIKVLKESDSKLSPKDKEEILKGTIKEASEESITTIFQQQTKYLEEELKKSLGLESLKESFDNIIKRLRREVSDLRLRANVNLVIGGAITLGGLYFLGITAEMMAKPNFLIHEIDGRKVSKEISEILLTYGPRVLLVIFIEIFAYFFLKLYKIGLNDIKYYQNELTNIESKLVSVEVAYITKNDESMKEALKVLVETERNFILKKGESTIELKREKMESDNIKDVLKEISSFLKSKP